MTVSIGVVWPQFNYFIKAKHALEGEEILLTFDDGPDPLLTPEILAVLRKHEVKAVFFVIGKKVKEYPQVYKQLLSEGHLTGNHTYDHHPLFSIHSESRVKQQINDAQKVMFEIGGQPTQLFRPPVGYTNPIIARVVKKMGLRVVGWKLRSYDTVLKNSDRLLRRLLRHTKKGSIVLLHDNLPQTARMLDEYITESKRRGFQFANEKTLSYL